MRNRQIGPDDATAVLAELVPQVSYKDGWTFRLEELERGQGCEGLTLLISFTATDSFDPSRQVGGVHLFPVLPAAYNRVAWEDWILECVHMVEKHETLEFFKVNGKQVYFPSHAPGHSPYTTMRIRTPEEAYAEAAAWHMGPVTDEHFA